MDADYYRFMFDYTYWGRDRILAAAEGLSDDEYQKPVGFTYDGLHSMLGHLLAAENVWCTRLRGEEFKGLIPLEEVSTMQTLKQRWAVEETRLRDYVSNLTDESVRGEIVVRRREGGEASMPVWLILSQLANHATQHRSEAAEALTMIGRSPGSLDLTTFYWEKQG